MFQKTAIYRKSSTGQEALARRDPALTMRHRSLLILVDGKRSVEELGRLTGGAGEFDPLMADLSDLRMIEAVSGTLSAAAAEPAARPPGPGSEPTTPAQAHAPSLTLAQAQRAAVRRLTDLMGPSAEPVCMKIESARDPQEFLAQVKRAEEMLRAVKGAAAVDSLKHVLEGYRPT